MGIRKEENLHHLKNGQNDWDAVPAEELSFLQRVAKRTRGIITVANGISIAGTVIFMNGLMDIANGNKGLGILKIGAGRACDVVDGEVANRTNTKGNFGRKLDPTLDMTQLFVGLPVLVSEGMVPAVAATVVAVPKIASTVGSTVGLLRHQEAEVPEEAKLGTFALWIGLASFAIGAAFEKHIPGMVDTTLESIGWVGSVGGTAYQLPATKAYLESGFGPTQPANEQPLI